MLNGRRRWLALGALAAALAVGASAALAASGAADDSFLGGVAKRLGITEDKLKDAIRDESIARIDQAVQDGDLTQEEGERLKERVRSGEQLGPFPGKPFAPSFGPDSAARHLAVPGAVRVDEPGLALDVDTAADLELVAGRLDPSSVTARRLRDIGVQGLM